MSEQAHSIFDKQAFCRRAILNLCGSLSRNTATRLSNWRVYSLQIAVSLVGLVSVASSNAQVGIDTDLWTFIPEANHHQAVVQVTSGNGIGTGVLIFVDSEKPLADGNQGYCLTAYHVVANDDGKGEIKVTYQNGRRARECQVVAFDEENDIAVLWVWVPNGIAPAVVAKVPLVAGQTLEISGLGGGSELECCIRHFQSEATFPTSGKTIFANVPLLPGDSGGPGFNENHEVVGIVSGGWFWIDGAVADKDGREIKTTWPARLSNVEPINKLIATIE